MDHQAKRLYLVTVPEGLQGFDAYDGYVIIADSGKEARSLAHVSEGYDPEVFRETLEVKEIKLGEAQSQVLLSAYTNG